MFMYRLYDTHLVICGIVNDNEILNKAEDEESPVSSNEAKLGLRAVLSFYKDMILTTVYFDSVSQPMGCDPILGRDCRPVASGIDDYKFERVQSFKYLGAEINESANSYEEVKKRITAANRCYYSLMPLFKSRLLSIKSKITLYKVIVKPVALYACSTWATTKSDEGKLAVFERKILRKIFGLKRNNDGRYEVRGNRELDDLYKEPTIVGSLKSTRISWAGHVWRSERMIGSITKWKPDTKRPRRRPRQRWVDRKKEDLKLLNVRNAEKCANDREEWKQYVVAAIGLKGL
ncbi:uncharacterized protein LOC112692922 [Sipha flava]|uniref:Uncharacterized protein LOC112692922 n=1 Tax=Sipha flava TaxID=143950 RepID=A0A8B8GLR1_9HEMI|nr:uncharacterized protein LOC112692922 [Sipha flava]